MLIINKTWGCIIINTDLPGGPVSKHFTLSLLEPTMTTRCLEHAFKQLLKTWGRTSWIDILCYVHHFIHWLFETSLHKTQGLELGFWCVVLSESSGFVCKYLQSIVIRHRAPDQRQCKVLFDFSQQNPLSYVSLVHEDLPFRIKQISVLLFANINK